jgi:hypothetical protein
MEKRVLLFLTMTTFLISSAVAHAVCDTPGENCADVQNPISKTGQRFETILESAEIRLQNSAESVKNFGQKIMRASGSSSRAALFVYVTGYHNFHISHGLVRSSHFGSGPSALLRVAEADLVLRIVKKMNESGELYEERDNNDLRQTLDDIFSDFNGLAPENLQGTFTVKHRDRLLDRVRDAFTALNNRRVEADAKLAQFGTETPVIDSEPDRHALDLLRSTR